MRPPDHSVLCTCSHDGFRAGPPLSASDLPADEREVYSSRYQSRPRNSRAVRVSSYNAARSGEVPLSQTGALVAAGRWHSSDVASSPKRANASQHFHAVPYTHTANTERRRTTVKESNNKKISPDNREFLARPRTSCERKASSLLAS